MYRYRYINKHVQFDQINYTLILEDLEDQSLPIVRIEKSFNNSDLHVDAEFLYLEARKEILRILAEQQTEPAVLDKEADLVTGEEESNGDTGE